jgi:hypothetical protein
MSNKLYHPVKISALLFSASIGFVALSPRPAQAGPFDFLNQINGSVNEVNNTVNGIKGTGANTNSAVGNLSDLLGVGKSSTPATAAADTGTQVLGVYADWYKAMSPADKEIINTLTSEYAEQGSVSFTTFKATDLYKSKTSADKQKASALFFKYSEVIKAVGPQKDKFLAFAFCVNGGGTNCK